MSRSPSPVLLVDPTQRIASLDAFGRLRVSEPFTIFDSKQIYDSQPLLFLTDTASGGAVTYDKNTASSRLTTVGANVGSRAIRQSKRYFNYQPGKSFLQFITFNLRGTQENVRKRVGYFDASNGIYLELNGTDISFQIRSSTSGSPVETVAAQGNWSFDNFDGTGPSGITLDFTKTQILIIDMEWLGVGTVRIGFVESGQVFYAHEFNHANIEEEVYMQSPNLPIRWEIENTGVASGTPQIDAICCSVISEGGVDPQGVVRSANRSNSTTSIGTDLQPVISIRLAPGFERITIRLVRFSLVSVSSGNYRWEIRLNPTVTGGTPASWQPASAAVESDIARDGVVSGGILIDSGYVANNTDSVTSFLESQLTVAADVAGVSDELVLCAANLGGSDTFVGSFTWLEVS